MPMVPAALVPLLRLTASAAWLPPLLARAVVGIAFIVAGKGKLSNLEQTIAFFESLNIPAASLQAPFVAGVELVGGILLVLGLGTRLAASLLIGVMGVALLTAILPPVDGVTAKALAGISSLEAAYLAIFVFLAIGGGGAASLDRLIWRRDA